MRPGVLAARGVSRRALVLALWGFWLATEVAVAADTQVWVRASDVHVEHFGDRFTVDVVFVAPVPQPVAWTVLTDFSHMAGFLPHLTSSEVLERHDNLLKVQQKGVARYAILSSTFETVRDIRLQGQTVITAHNVAGTLRQMDSVMQLQADRAAGTRMHYHADAVPGIWIPPLIGVAVVRQEIAEQFSAMVREMLRELARRQCGASCRLLSRHRVIAK